MTPTQYKILAGELAEGSYAALSNEEAAAALSAVTVSARRFVKTDVLINVAMQTANYAAIRMIADGRLTELGGQAIPMPLIGACIILMDTFTQPKAFPEIDLDNPSVVALIGGLVAGGLLSQAEADGINALADAQISRAEQLGLPAVTADDVHNAREGDWSWA